MRFSLIALFIFLSIKTFSQDDYIIQINDTTFDISLEKSYSFTYEGKDIQFSVLSKDTLVYDDDLFGFKYSKDYKISHMKIDEGINQLLIMTAEGSGFLIQKYTSMNPTMLNEMMLTEVTKESLNYGFQLKRNDYSRKLKSGQTLDIAKVTLTYKDETNIYEVASIGKKDEGILVMSMIMDENMSEQGQKIIELMWNSLIYK